jgi:hypothetical protein
MPAHNAYLGEVVHHLKSGRVRRFRPQGEVHTVNAKGAIVTAKEAAEGGDWSLTIVHKKGRYLLQDEDGTVLGNYGTQQEAEKAKTWWLDVANKRLAKVRVESLPVGGLAARIFVGLNVGTETKYTIQDFMQQTLKVRRSQGKRADGSFLGQMGIYEDTKGRTIEEPSVQIVLLDLGGEEEKVWTREMLALGGHLRRKFHQETVIVEIQQQGIARAVYSITA